MNAATYPGTAIPELTDSQIKEIFLFLDTQFDEGLMAYESSDPVGIPLLATLGFSAILSTILADATLIWRCWIVWGRSRRAVLIPIVCTTFVISELTKTNLLFTSALNIVNVVNWAVLYSSLIQATLLWCMILIIYRILKVGGVSAGMGVYHRVIEMLVESASLYSAVIVKRHGVVASTPKSLEFAG
ncbi:uncharacterized protein BT62DRAFT_997406 [Guyanagaster necrorhizus]|uniref:Uncharacterized protein n=1 Tax=Guyanagaster necrorhizus TaxID=856835 RepID=A0A9P7VJG5_9AGAR|nr:uncharacterized protein BT62DRAFT_997406 [Guyanagaster necrorhizus MCA 3950]KAG7441074.1 hypothetical protein BT62DRAFT_997406 [Guyanagaster necrorhizus MCA 3950]